MASTSYFFSYFFLFFQNIPIYSYFCSEIPIFPIFSLIWNKTYRYLQVCSYMTISATVKKKSILHLTIPRSIIKHNMCMYEKHICYLKMISHKYINDCFCSQSPFPCCVFYHSLFLYHSIIFTGEDLFLWEYPGGSRYA